MNKYPEDKPFGEWTPEQQREFKIEVLVDGKQWQARFHDGQFVWCRNITGKTPVFASSVFYRIAPEPEIPDSIDWSHVHPDLILLSRSVGCSATLSNHKSAIRAWMYASYKRGNMESCIVYRPGFEPKDQI